MRKAQVCLIPALSHLDVHSLHSDKVRISQKEAETIGKLPAEQMEVAADSGLLAEQVKL